MDYWQTERKAAERHAELLRESAAWQLEQEALRGLPVKPDWFARNMFTFGNWMITAGERIRKRYAYTPSSRRTMDRYVSH
jgi:hypothetical protein